MSFGDEGQVRGYVEAGLLREGLLDQAVLARMIGNDRQTSAWLESIPECREGPLQLAGGQGPELLQRFARPQPGDADTMLGRIARIEAELAASEDPATLARLYNDAWRLSWDNDDAGLTRRVFDARDAIAHRLGAELVDRTLSNLESGFFEPAAEINDIIVRPGGGPV